MEDTTLNIEKRTDTKKGIIRWALQMVFFTVLLAVILFGIAGKPDWKGAWYFLGLNIFTSVLSALILIPKRPEMLAGRTKVSRNTKSFDRILAPAVAIFGTIAIIITSSLDERFGWTGGIDTLVLIISFVVAFASQMFVLWAMASNPFFDSTVHIQTDKGHHAITTGPYRIIRHPGYLGSVFFTLSAPLILCSYYALIPAFITVILTFIRTALEDKTLQAELPGYKEYAGNVKYKIIPGVW